VKTLPYFDVMLPYPPSMNTGWRCVLGVMKLAKRQRIFRRVVADKVRAVLFDKDSPYKRIEMRPCSVTMTIYPPTRRKYDLDNLAKPVLDALMHAGVMEDDSQVRHLEITKGDVMRPTGGCFVLVQALEE
jgi:crossover junction endodeoxyribonuclease RusA